MKCNNNNNNNIETTKKLKKKLKGLMHLPSKWTWCQTHCHWKKAHFMLHFDAWHKSGVHHTAFTGNMFCI